MGKSHPMELRSRVIAFVEEEHGHRGEPMQRQRFERVGEHASSSGFTPFLERDGDSQA